MLLFLKVFFTEFIAEMGDKTQLMCKFRPNGALILK